jgi:hypothetical protein
MSRPSASTGHSSSSEQIPPGNRRPTPTIATALSGQHPACTLSGRWTSPPLSRHCRQRTAPAGHCWSPCIQFRAYRVRSEEAAEERLLKMREVLNAGIPVREEALPGRTGRRSGLANTHRPRRETDFPAPAGRASWYGGAWLTGMVPPSRDAGHGAGIGACRPVGYRGFGEVSGMPEATWATVGKATQATLGKGTGVRHAFRVSRPRVAEAATQFVIPAGSARICPGGTAADRPQEARNRQLHLRACPGAAREQVTGDLKPGISEIVTERVKISLTET